MLHLPSSMGALRTEEQLWSKVLCHFLALRCLRNQNDVLKDDSETLYCAPLSGKNATSRRHVLLTNYEEWGSDGRLQSLLSKVLPQFWLAERSQSKSTAKMLGGLRNQSLEQYSIRRNISIDIVTCSETKVEKNDDTRQRTPAEKLHWVSSYWIA